MNNTADLRTKVYYDKHVREYQTDAIFRQTSRKFRGVFILTRPNTEYFFYSIATWKQRF